MTARPKAARRIQIKTRARKGVPEQQREVLVVYRQRPAEKSAGPLEYVEPLRVLEKKTSAVD